MHIEVSVYVSEKTALYIEEGVQVYVILVCHLLYVSVLYKSYMNSMLEADQHAFWCEGGHQCGSNKD